MYIDDLPNAEEVKKWIKSFKRVMKKCPSNLWFFSGTGLSIMVAGKDGAPVFKGIGGGVDPEYCIYSESSHLWEGGDW